MSPRAKSRGLATNERLALSAARCLDCARHDDRHKIRLSRAKPAVSKPVLSVVERVEPSKDTDFMSDPLDLAGVPCYRFGWQRSLLRQGKDKVRP